MNITSLVSNRFADVEHRKRVLRHKTADAIYRRNAQYFKPKTNPALENLVDLLTGKKEQEHKPEVQSSIRKLQQLHKHDDQVNQTIQDVSSTRITIQSQSSQIPDSATRTNQKKTYTDTANSSKTTVEEKVKHRLFEKAISHYTFQVQVAKQGFQLAQPTIYLSI
ncbi:hypothetical protein ACWV26_01460 [Rummeliibacillus sp. JY-2-4R]